MSAGPGIDQVRAVADAVLYEGYLLYPYRASAQKNHSRWQFGVLMPPGYTAVDPSESSALKAQCVFEQRDQPLAVDVTVRFLQVQRRYTEGAAPDPGTPAVWDEAVEREVTVSVTAAELCDGQDIPFAIPGGEDAELVPGGRLVRRREPLAATVSVRATPLPGPWRAARLTVRVTNESRQRQEAILRDEALPGALVAAHLIITMAGGAFLSMTDPPEWARPEVAACENTGWWPVLAGPEDSRQVMLVAPIILPEHPQIAPESPGDLFDGTEIDEILTLRTLALSDAEKAAARATDPRAAALIDRVDAMDAPTMQQLHGTIRAMTGSGAPSPGTSASPVAGHEEGVPWWDPGADASVSPGTDSVIVNGFRVAMGSRVILRPGSRRADAQDMFLAGREALVEAVLIDVDDTRYLAVTLADDPAADLQAAHGRFLYFSPDEVEPCP
ncbi:MAG TPA: hypothetical protein VHV09_14710 [Trebonia sp.]|nr:hypothetical protein [Trebonia sp.]